MNADAGTPDARDAFAAEVAKAMYRRDVTARRLGIALEEVRMGWCRMSMPVTADMLNGHGVCHGGFIFTLADTAFAYACNGRNRVSLAQHAQISFIAVGNVGEVLTATAREVSLHGRSGLTDVEILGGDGRTVAAFRGASRTVRGLTDANLGEAPPA